MACYGVIFTFMEVSGIFLEELSKNTYNLSQDKLISAKRFESSYHQKKTKVILTRSCRYSCCLYDF